MRPAIRRTAQPGLKESNENVTQRTRSDWRQRLLPDEGAGQGRADGARDAVRPAVGSVLPRTNRRDRSRFSLASRPRPSNFAVGNKFPRQCFRDEAARRHASGFGIDGGQPERGNPSGRAGGSESVYRSHIQASRDVLRRRLGRARFAGRSGVRESRERPDQCGENRRRGDSQWRDVSVHGGSAILDARRVESLPQLGRERHQHDGDAGGAARARGGDVLRGAGAGDGLRLLARNGRGGGYRRDPARDESQRGQGAERGVGARAHARQSAADLRLPGRAEEHDNHRSRRRFRSG